MSSQPVDAENGDYLQGKGYFSFGSDEGNNGQFPFSLDILGGGINGNVPMNTDYSFQPSAELIAMLQQVLRKQDDILSRMDEHDKFRKQLHPILHPFIENPDRMVEVFGWFEQLRTFVVDDVGKLTRSVDMQVTALQAEYDSFKVLLESYYTRVRNYLPDW